MQSGVAKTMGCTRDESVSRAPVQLDALLQSGAAIDFESCGDASQRLVRCPELAVPQDCRREQMGVDPPDASAVQSPALDERHDVCLSCQSRRRKLAEQCQKFRPVLQIPQCQFSDDEGMTQQPADRCALEPLRVRAPRRPDA